MKKLFLSRIYLLALCLSLLITVNTFAAQNQNYPEADFTWSFVQGQELEVKAEVGTTYEILTPGLVSCIANKGGITRFSTDQKGHGYILFHQPTKGDFLYHLIIGGEENQIKIEVVSTTHSGLVRDEVMTERNAETFAERVLELVNIERTSRGIPPLRLARDLMQAAAIRAEEISRVMSHTRPNGLPCQSMFHDGQYTIGENIAGGYTTPEAAVQGWMDSPGHRANILNPDYKELGVGYYYKSNTTYQEHWVQMFRRPMPRPSYYWW